MLFSLWAFALDVQPRNAPFSVFTCATVFWLPLTFSNHGWVWVILTYTVMLLCYWFLPAKIAAVSTSLGLR